MMVARLVAMTLFTAAVVALFTVGVMFLAVDSVDWPILGAALLVLPIAAMMWRRGAPRRNRPHGQPSAPSGTG